MSAISLPARIEALSAKAPERIAIVGADETLTYGMLWERIVRSTARLAHEWHVAPGDRVAFLGLNHADQLILLGALMRLGAIQVPLNYRLAPLELRAIVEHAGATLVVTDDTFADIAAGLGIPHRMRAELARATDASRDALNLGAAGPDTPALLVYTSGTTGTPKGAIHTHGGLYWNAQASIAMHDLTADDRVLTALPLFHVGGLCIQTIPALYAGASIVLQPRFDAGAWLDAVGAWHPTTSLLVPATMRALQEHPRWHDADLSSLRSIGAGSSTIPTALIERFHQRGIPVCQIYGATETGPVSIVLRADEAFAHVGAAGRAAMGCEIRLVGPDGDEILDDGIGEIHVRAPNVMQGYWREPAHPAFVDRWFHTGDLARRDAAGFFTVAGRAQDLIISGGENIYPAEIENVLAGIAEVADAAVIGVPDPRWGEAPVAVVVLRPGSTLTEATLRARFEAVLARFKHPRRIVFRATLPRNAMGKVQKRILIDELCNQPPP